MTSKTITKIHVNRGALEAAIEFGKNWGKTRHDGLSGVWFDGGKLYGTDGHCAIQIGESVWANDMVNGPDEVKAGGFDRRQFTDEELKVAIAGAKALRSTACTLFASTDARSTAAPIGSIFTGIDRKLVAPSPEFGWDAELLVKLAKAQKSLKMRGFRILSNKRACGSLWQMFEGGRGASADEDVLVASDCADVFALVMPLRATNKKRG